MTVALPLLAYPLFALVFLLRENHVRESSLKAAVLWGLCAVLMLEVLSPFRAVSPTILVTTWALVDVAAIGASLALGFTGRSRLKDAAARLDVDSFGSSSALLLAAVTAAVAVVGFVAVAAAPNTYDAMTYHLPRLPHWLDNRTVAFYPTNIARQLHTGPGAEYLMFHLYALSGHDRLVSAVQWFSYASSIVGVTLLARAMGAGARGQALAAVVCATIPQGILSASGPKNDYVLALWLVCFFYFLLQYGRDPSLTNAGWAGGALGLAVLTKATGAMFALPIGLVWWLFLPGRTKRRTLRHMPMAIALAALVNLAHGARNTQLYGSPIGPISETSGSAYQYTNDGWAPAFLLSNLLRNIALYAATPSRALNGSVQSAIEGAIRATGGDPNDPRTTWTSTSFRVPRLSLNEDFAGNPLHVVLSLFALILVVCHRGASRNTCLAALALSVAFLLFCMVLKWQPWHVRLHLPLFVLGAGVVAAELDRALPRSATTMIGALLIVAALPFLLANDLRPLIPLAKPSILATSRARQYFSANPVDEADYVRAAEMVQASGCGYVGLDLESNSYEYPWLMWLRGHDRLIVHTSVRNGSSRLDDPRRGRPCMVICVNCAEDRGRQAQYLGRGYTSRTIGKVVLFGALPDGARSFEERESTSVLPPGGVARVDEYASLVDRAQDGVQARAGQDFSVAVFDTRGRMVAQGPYSPGHMGAMSAVVRNALAAHPIETLRPGDAILLNDPLLGSGHFPDFFITQPAFHESHLIGFAVNIVHHTDVGGSRPGSRASRGSSTTSRKGFASRPPRSGRSTRSRRAWSASSPPTRTPDKVLGDLRGAQRAAGR